MGDVEEEKENRIKRIYKVFSPRVSTPLRAAVQFLSKTMPLHGCDLKRKIRTFFSYYKYEEK